MGDRRFALACVISTACVACGALLGSGDDSIEPAPPVDASDEDVVVVSEDATPDKIETPDACAALDLATAPRHCGSCDHDCLGTPCANGVCQPQVLAKPGFQNHLVVTNDRLV